MARKVIALLMVPVLALAVGALAVSAVNAPGCGAATAPTFASESFTPVAGQLTSAIYPTFQSQGAAMADQSGVAAVGLSGVAVPPGLAPLFIIRFGPSNNATMIVYSSSALPAQATVVDLARAGGLEISRQPAGNGSAADVLGAVGDRAVALKVGPYDAAIVHTDPVGSDDIRPYELHWSDGTSDYMVFGSLPAVEVIDTARSLYCH